MVLKSSPSSYTETEQLRHAAFEPSRNRPSNPSRPIPYAGDAGKEEGRPYKIQESGCISSFVCNGHDACKELVKVRNGSVMRRQIDAVGLYAVQPHSGSRMPRSFPGNATILITIYIF